MTVGDKNTFPVLDTMSIARITLAPGAFREPHWNVAANALGYCTAGRLLVTIFHTGNSHSIFVIDPGQMFFVPAGALHTVENLAQQEVAFVVTYSQPVNEGFGLSGSVGTFTRGDTYPPESTGQWLGQRPHRRSSAEGTSRINP